MTNRMTGRDAVTTVGATAWGLGDLPARPSPGRILLKVPGENTNGTSDEDHMETRDLCRDGHRDRVHDPDISLEAGTLQTLLKSEEMGEHVHGAHTCKLWPALSCDFFLLKNEKDSLSILWPYNSVQILLVLSMALLNGLGTTCRLLAWHNVGKESFSDIWKILGQNLFL